MRFLAVLMFLAAASVMSLTAMAQPGGEKGAPPKRGEGDKGRDGDKGRGGFDIQDSIKRMLSLDVNKDGKITKDEMTEERLGRLFERADADKDGVVTTAELEAVAKSIAAQPPGGRPGGPGGPGGFSGRFGPPQPGQIMAPFVQDALKLTDEQKQQIADIQKDVEAKIGKVLTDEQKEQLKEMRSRMQGGPGGPGGRPGARPGEPGQRPAPPKD